MIQYKSINHLNTSLSHREEAFADIRQEAAGTSVFLQTCNRMELYFGEGDVPRQVARHLFRVVSGLESAIVGERAVQGQVKEAYLNARTHKRLPAGIHKLFECALEVGKRVRNETRISHGAVSHSLAAIEIIEKEQVDLKQARIVLIGVNKLTADIMKFLQNKGAQRISLGNRTIDNARQLAEPLGVEVFDLARKREHLEQADVLISATSAPGVVVGYEDMRVRRPLLAIDLAFPRDIDPRLADDPQVSLYNLQDVERTVQQNISIREEEVKKAELLIEEEIDTLEEIMLRRKQHLLQMEQSV